MKLLYINDELISSDGSNSHAIGMLKAFEEILGAENVQSYPQPEDGSGKLVNLKAQKLKIKLKGSLAVLRYFRKSYLSRRRSIEICATLKQQGFVPTHILARSTDFDVTAIYVAKELKAKLIYEINTPLFYERGVLKQEPMIRKLEKWEKKIIDRSDYVYVVSNICRDMLCEHYHVSKDKFIVVPNGYIKELYHENEYERMDIRNRVRKAEGLEDKFVVTFVGSLKMWHGINKFCDTAQRMESDRRVVFMVLGDGEMHDMIAEYTSKYENMIFKGKVDLETMKKYLYASDLGIMPYEKMDNFYYSPLKMYDMIGAGLPFVGTNIGQISEVCSLQLSSDFLLEDGSSKMLQQSIYGVIKNEEVLSQMARVLQNKRCNMTWSARAEYLINQIKTADENTNSN